MNLFFQTFPTNVLVLMRNVLLIMCLFGMVILPILSAEGCVKRPSLEPSPGAAIQYAPHTYE